MELTPLRYFIAICEARHMTRAAEGLGVSQPALSAAVRKLEAEAGAALLHRTGHGVEATDAGRIFLARARAAVREADAALEQVRQLVGLEIGSIRVGGGATATSYLLPPVVSAIRRRHPDLRFFVREAGSRAVAAGVLGAELDLGIVTEPISHPGSGELMTTGHVRDELRLIVPPGHRLDGRRSFRWKDLVDEPIVAFEAGTAVRGVIDQACSEAGVELMVVMELRSIESIKRMVAAGIGAGFVSRFALAKDRDSGQTAAAGLSCKDGRLERTLAVIRRRDRVPSPAVAAFERELLGQLRG